jgi:hypothetical protein
MNRPRDHSADVTKGAVRLARTYSNIVSPPVVFAVLALALAWQELSFWPGLFWAAVFGFWVSLAPILIVVYLLRTGRITDVHMNTARERRIPYLSSAVGALVALALLGVFSGPELLRCLAIYSLISVVILGLINVVWLISIHMASITAAALISGLVFGPLAALALIPLTVLVFLARLFLRRHTIPQLLAGTLVGIVCVLVVLGLGCFY